MKFACPSVVLREGETNSGATECSSRGATRWPKFRLNKRRLQHSHCACVPKTLNTSQSLLLFSHPPGEQHHGGPECRRNHRRYDPLAERQKHRDVIADQRAGNAHQCACDDAAG